MPECERDSARTYERIARAIAVYEHPAELNPFTSKFDYYRFYNTPDMDPVWLTDGYRP